MSRIIRLSAPGICLALSFASTPAWAQTYDPTASDPYGNTASGYYAMGPNNGGGFNTGQSNTADGSGTLQNNTSGSNNIAVGYNALQNNTSGSDNVAVGREAALANHTGYYNTAVGYQALQSFYSQLQHGHRLSGAAGFRGWRHRFHRLQQHRHRRIRARLRH